MATRTCRVCRERRATLCDSCGPHQAAPELRPKVDHRAGLREIEDKAQGIMRAIDEQLPPGWGAVLLFSTHGSKGYASYVSTLDRSSMPTFLRECATMVEERSDRPPGRLGVEN